MNDNNNGTAAATEEDLKVVKSRARLYSIGSCPKDVQAAHRLHLMQLVLIYLATDPLATT